MNILAIIPARMGSSRFPGKPMALINGIPMVGHVYTRVTECKKLTKTIVATCDQVISDYVSSIGGEAVMTSSKHERASDRAAEALLKIEKQDGISYDVIVMIQGDEPMIHSDMVESALQPFYESESVNVVNLVADILWVDEFHDRNCIKVVLDNKSRALFFSREPIPTSRDGQDIPMKKQVCVIPFSRSFLMQYQEMEPTPLEIIESVDMMRVLENGYDVQMVHTDFQTFAVDTPDDLRKVEALMQIN